MRSPMNKRRRISEDGKPSPIKESTTTSHKGNLLPNYMTPTKASLAKSYPQLAAKAPPTTTLDRIPSPIRQPPRRSIPPDSLTEVIQVNNNNSNNHGLAGRSFLDIANEDDPRMDDGRGPTGMAMNMNKRSIMESHLSSEEEIERQKGVLMRKLRVLRAECENLEQQLDQAKLLRQIFLDSQKKAQTDVDATMYLSSI
jgi:hypothetical protein